MNQQNKVSAVVLAGGQSRRMQQDKGLMLFKQKPLVSYAIQAALTVTDEVKISANRHLDQYLQWDLPVIQDADAEFNGPLAGILAAMSATQRPMLLVLPCDSPLLTGQVAERLINGLTDQIDIAVAFDGERYHPVFLALKTKLRPSLQAYLDSGERRLQNWLFSQIYVAVDFSDQPQLFTNLNTPEQLQALELD